MVMGGKEYTRLLPMKDSEIVKNYREAKNKKAQIDILADLNACEPDVIRAVLKKNGVDLRGGNYRAKKPAENAVQEMPKETEAKEEKKDGCLKDKTGSCEGCDDKDICFGYMPEVTPVKPPLGLKPRDVAENQFLESRIRDIVCAMSRYYEAGTDIPPEWREELKERL